MLLLYTVSSVPHASPENLGVYEALWRRFLTDGTFGVGGLINQEALGLWIAEVV